MRRYIPELDGLRGIAILLVMIHRLFPRAGGTPVLRPLYPDGRIQSPLTPDVVARLQAIAALGPDQRDGAVAKVGDSTTASPSFVTCFDGSAWDLGSRDELAAVRADFATSFARASLAAVGGWTAADPLAGAPPPLDQETSATAPRYALVMLGTSDDRYGRTLDAYGADLWTIVDRLIARGIVPILSTIPAIHGDPDADHRVALFDGVVRALAQGYALPLVDFHAALAALPDEGISADGIHPTVAPAGACVLTAAGLAYGYNTRNLLALEALARARAALAGTASDGEPASACGGGRGIVYQLALAQPTAIAAFVVERAPTDVDVRLVQGGQCLASGAASASATLAAGPAQVIVASRSGMTEGSFAVVVQPQ